MKKGISLIVLIITIIIILILTGAVILSFTDSNPIETANEAVFKSDISNFKGSLVMHIANEMTKDGVTPGSVTMSSIDADAAATRTILQIPTGKYDGYFGIVDGEIIYDATVVTDTIIQGWLDDAGIVAGTIPTTPAS